MKKILLAIITLTFTISLLFSAEPICQKEKVNPPKIEGKGFQNRGQQKGFHGKGLMKGKMKKENCPNPECPKKES